MSSVIEVFNKNCEEIKAKMDKWIKDNPNKNKRQMNYFFRKEIDEHIGIVKKIIKDLECEKE